MRKFRLKIGAIGYYGPVVAGGVYNENHCPWAAEELQHKTVLDSFKEYPEDWEEVFEVNLEGVVSGLTARVEKLEKILAGDVEEFDETEQTKEVLYKFVGDIRAYRWDINPVRGHTYTLDQIAKMFGSTFENPEKNLSEYDWEKVGVVENLPAKYQLIEVRDSDSQEWKRALFMEFYEGFTYGVRCAVGSGKSLNEINLKFNEVFKYWRFIVD